MTFSEFLYMDGYAFYVWTSYGLFLIVLTLNLILPWKRKRQLERKIEKTLRRSKRK